MATDREIELVARALAQNEGDPDVLVYPPMLGQVRTPHGAMTVLPVSDIRPLPLWQMFKAAAKTAIESLDRIRTGDLQ